MRKESSGVARASRVDEHQSREAPQHKMERREQSLQSGILAMEAAGDERCGNQEGQDGHVSQPALNDRLLVKVGRCE